MKVWVLLVILQGKVGAWQEFTSLEACKARQQEVAEVYIRENPPFELTLSCVGRVRHAKYA